MSGSGCKRAGGTHMVSRLETKTRDTEISLRGVTRGMEDNLYPPHADPECHRRKRGARSERTLSSSPPLWEWGYTSVHRKPLSDAQISCEGLRRSSAGM